MWYRYYRESYCWRRRWCYGHLGYHSAPFTGGLSLGLTLGGTGLGVVGGVTNITAVVNIIKVSDELMTICVHAFTKAQEYLKTEKSKKLRLCRRKPPATVDT